MSAAPLDTTHQNLLDSLDQFRLSMPTELRDKALFDLLVAMVESQIAVSDDMVRTLAFLHAMYPGMTTKA